MERKLKELNATLDQERSQHVEQRDQVNSEICISNFHWLRRETEASPRSSELGVLGELSRNPEEMSAQIRAV